MGSVGQNAVDDVPDANCSAVCMQNHQPNDERSVEMQSFSHGYSTDANVWSSSQDGCKLH